MEVSIKTYVVDEKKALSGSQKKTRRTLYICNHLRLVALENVPSVADKSLYVVIVVDENRTASVIAYKNPWIFVEYRQCSRPSRY